MTQYDTTSNLTDFSRRRLLVYVADLELEVDRLRRHNQLIYKEVWGALAHFKEHCATMATTDDPPSALTELGQEIQQLSATLRDLRDPPGYHPVYDQVTAVAVRPLVEQIFRWQQRFLQTPDVALRFEMESEHVEWFPARLRHILDSLISNALKYRDGNKAEQWVLLQLRVSPANYEFCVSDNGIGLEPEERNHVFELFYRAAPAREAALGVGLAVVKLLVEQSGGTLTVESKPDQGTTFAIVLPRYEIDDYLT